MITLITNQVIWFDLIKRNALDATAKYMSKKRKKERNKIAALGLSATGDTTASAIVLSEMY